MSLDLSYGAHANPDLLKRVPVDARAVLDVGCGAGALGAALRARNAATRLIGVEPDEALAARAAAHYDQVLRLDIEATPPPVPEGSLDALVFGDVLEHLRDPWAVLKRDARLLSDRGLLLICIPNVEHWSFVARLLAGTWQVQEQGLLDATHLRWFTRDSMRRAIEAAGLTPIAVAPRVLDLEKARAFATRFAPALTALAVDPQAWLQRAAPLQYVWTARRA
jgi:SAM-dependent methyltransferase